ncbi:hypothetical protein [Lacticaseibacillus nasuensis]|uniref:hypothetical protein n=1 Tax=Lacticaseibacillus nasuensis TaxID=944671 RepID=UPI0006CF4345|nr:hypothetical protein [Lacticaseibacillus nasuensis]
MVDYLTRYAQTGEVKMAFDIPLKGLQLAKSYSPGLPMIAEAKELIPKIKDFSEESLNAATKFTTYFDTYYRAGPRAVQYLKPEAPNEQTRKNMMIMVDRAITFFLRMFLPCLRRI